MNEQQPRRTVIPFQTEAGREIYVEVTKDYSVVADGTTDGGLASGDKAARMIKELEEVGDSIADICQRVEARVRTKLKTAKPKELTLEFGVTLAGEAGIPMVTKGSVEGTFQVTAMWDFSE